MPSVCLTRGFIISVNPHPELNDAAIKVNGAFSVLVPSLRQRLQRGLLVGEGGDRRNVSRQGRPWPYAVLLVY